MRADLRVAFADACGGPDARTRVEQCPRPSAGAGRRDSEAGRGRRRGWIRSAPGRARSSRHRHRSRRCRHRARPRAGDPGELLRRRRPIPHASLRSDRSRASAAIPPVEALVEQAESSRGELLALRQEIESARFAERAADRRWIPEPEVVAGTKSSSVGGGDIGSVFTVHATIPLFDRARPERALAIARGRPGRGARHRLPASPARPDCSASRRRHRTPRRGRALPRARPSIPPIKSSGSRKSATTRASAASSSCWMRIEPGRPRACVRRRSTRRSDKPKLSWSSPAGGRFSNDHEKRSPHRHSDRGADHGRL